MISRTRAVFVDAALAAIGYERHPPLRLDAERSAAFEALASESVDVGGVEAIAYDLPWPKYEFLQWLRLHRAVVFHGSPRDDLTALSTVRLSRDAGAFGDQQAVYASDDPVWAMYFAVLRRRSAFRWTNNAALRPVGDRERLPRYSFAVNEEALGSGLLGNGTLYLLPRATFRPEARVLRIVDTCHLVSYEEVRPLARMVVESSDFPFSTAIFTTARTGSELRLAIARWRSRLARRRSATPP